MAAGLARVQGARGAKRPARLTWTRHGMQGRDVRPGLGGPGRTSRRGVHGPVRRGLHRLPEAWQSLAKEKFVRTRLSGQGPDRFAG